jgi:hypothetical protein
VNFFPQINNRAMLRYCLLFLGAIIYYGTSYSQQVIATDGNYVAASQGSLSWTLGEVITETFSNTNGFLTQGFQQKDKDILQLNDLSLESRIKVYPSPFTSEITISIDGEHPDYKVFVRDYQYKHMLETEASFQTGIQQMTIDLSELSDGFYFLIIRATSTDKRFVARIIKTNN